MTVHRALGFRFSFDVGHEPLATYLAEVFGALAEPHGTAAGVRPFTVTPVEPKDDGQLRFDLALGDKKLRVAKTAPQIVDTIVQTVNAECLPSRGWLSSHAAGLVRAGFEYVSEEAVAPEGDSGCIEPFPKPLSLDPGSWSLFPELDQRDGFPPGAVLTQPPGARRRLLPDDDRRPRRRGGRGGSAGRVVTGMTPTDAPARGAHVYAVEVDGEAVLLDESDNRLHRLNATATLHQIASEISEELGLPFDTVLADALAVANDLREQGLSEEPA